MNRNRVVTLVIAIVMVFSLPTVASAACYVCMGQGTYEVMVYGCSNTGDDPGAYSCYNTSTFCTTWNAGCGGEDACSSDPEEDQNYCPDEDN